MEDTPQHVKKIQLQIWLSKSPAERLYQAIQDNEAQFAFWKHAKEQLSDGQNLESKEGENTQ